ncbi:hypothetical protein ABB37_03382 [Leptomonas pyrrhocoris]|uniref:Uncharacterized protein n=1 Tax=Leptomonas pyrrhocoris TaxID=157538 RepID=A0A0N0VG00_LEPPY|nr:hypothetical protein ABB37_03382 [Leptomonas pyrrhocoris]KPA82274.1 hypothetical protein ABB37_03382 [Leptomonas pyrrhocoris]|eukprot:XP_015660713.1 hypothetical protein ABB37_03382 [Leptomonas pyrrhocoris]
MDPAPQVPPVGSSDVQVEVVTSEGHPVATRTVRVEDLLQQHDHTLDVGDGIALRLEELNAQQDYSDDEDNEDADTSLSSSRSSNNGDGSDAEELGEGKPEKRRTASSGGRIGAPPGTRATNDWYDVLDALRREQQDVERTAAEVEASRRTPQEGEGRLVKRHPNSLQSTSTPLKRFASATSMETKSIAGDRASSAALPPGASRHDVWASLAPPKDTVSHNYNVLRYVSYMSALDYRRFRPTALAFHAAASYLSRKDRGQRLLVYGGLSFGARKVEHELYEFSVLTGNWRRIEGRQLVPAGHYGHTLTVVEPLDRVVVVGGIGPGGVAASKEVTKAWTGDPMRAPRYNFLCPLLRRGSGLVGGVAAATRGPAAHPASTHGAVTPTVGFVSLLFDMNLSDLAWRAIQPAQPFPLAYHTAVHFEKEIFVFGGLTEELRVSGQLLAINPDTYAVRLITTASAAGLARSRRDRSGSTRSRTEGSETAATTATTTTAEEELAGPGPRFLHTAVRYGPYMIVYGGYNAHNEAQGDCWAFDMVNERWERLRCRGEAAARAGHECCVVGCRMMVVGGFECSLEEAGTNAAAPATTVMQLNLVPTSQGEHLWRSAVKLRPALPPLAFTRCAPCGEDHSLILFGGATQLPRRGRSKSGGRRTESAKRRAREGHSADDSAEEEDDAPQEDGLDGTQAKHTAAGTDRDARHKGLLGRLVPFDDGLVFTFPIRQQRKKHTEDEPVVNALGVAVDPNELPEHFKTFVRRQEDFVKKKDAAAADTMRKVTVEEQESMEPTLYLTADEIELLLQKSEDCCVAFAQRYPMESLPSNVPDREERLHLMEECISESRQVRDVLKSMKGSAPGVTAVKSKTHRKRTGRKFEDYSAAKPFRRVVVMHLIESINTHLARMHRLNKALRTVDWEEKAGFLEAVDDMQNTVHAVSRAINGVMRKYIQHRVDSLVKGVDKHKEVMRLLTQVVEKNRHDKIWGVEESRDEQRHETHRAQAANTRTASSAVPAASKGRPKSQKRSASSTAATRPRGSRSRSLGGGYHADESKAVVYLMDKEWSKLLARTQAVEKCATRLQRYCRDGISTTATAGTITAMTTTTAGVPLMMPSNGTLSLQPPQTGAAPPAASPQPLLPPPQLTVPQVHPAQTGLPVPTPLAPYGAPALAVLPPTAAIVPTAAAAEVGTARPRDIMIQHSNELRAKIATAAEEVGSAAAIFYTTLMQQDADKERAAEPRSGSSSTSVSQHAGQPTSEHALQSLQVISSGKLPPPQLPPPPPATAAATLRRSNAARASPGSSRSSSSSTATSRSSASSSSPLAAAAAAPTQNAVEPQMPAPPDLGLPLLPPPPATAGISLPDQTGVPQPSGRAFSSHEIEKEVPHSEKKPKAEAAATAAASVPAAPAGHALRLSSLRPLLAAKDALLACKDKVSRIRKNEWDGNDLAGAPQDVEMEELYRRLEKCLTAVAQSVTASFLSKAGARPPRSHPASTSVVAPPPRAKSQGAKRSSRSASAPPAKPGLRGSPAPPPQLAQSLASSTKKDAQRGGGGDFGFSTSARSTMRGSQLRAESSGVPDAGEPLRLKPLPQKADDGDWWATVPLGESGSGATKGAAAAVPLVPADALVRDVRLDGASSPNVAAEERFSIQTVFQNVRTVPNTDAAFAPATRAVHLDGFSEDPWSLAPAGRPPHSAASGPFAATVSPKQQPAAVSLSVVPKVVMPSLSTDANRNDQNSGGGNRLYERNGGIVVSPKQKQQQRRRSTIEELTQLPHSAFPVGAGGSDGVGNGLDSGMGVVAREPMTSISGGNFAVNTEYLHRVAPQTIPAALLNSDASDARVNALDPYNSGVSVGARHDWADVDDDYFYFGRPAENRVAPGDAVVSGPPYITVAPALGSGRVGVSPPVGSVLGSQRVNAELATAPQPSASRRGGESYRSTTASQARKAQTARPVRKDGPNSKRFYTPGELQLMQARERLRSKPQQRER